MFLWSVITNLDAKVNNKANARTKGHGGAAQANGLDSGQTGGNPASAGCLSVGRWEAIRPPTGIALARLHRLAAREGEAKLAKVFWRALEQEAEAEGRADSQALILEIYTWSGLGHARADLDADIRKLETEQLKDSDLTKRLKMHTEALYALFDKIRYLRWRERDQKTGEKVDQ